MSKARKIIEQSKWYAHTELDTAIELNKDELDVLRQDVKNHDEALEELDGLTKERDELKHALGHTEAALDNWGDGTLGELRLKLQNLQIAHDGTKENYEQLKEDFDKLQSENEFLRKQKTFAQKMHDNLKAIYDTSLRKSAR